MNEQAAEDFRSQVQRLVAEGKLTPEEARDLLADLNGPEPQAAAVAQEPEAAPGAEAHRAAGAGEPRSAPATQDLVLKVSGYLLTVVHDAGVPEPQLSANPGGELRLSSGPEGWKVERERKGHDARPWPPLQAILSVPFMPRQVRARVEGGNLTLPDTAGELQAEVNGGVVRTGRALALKAEVNGGNLSAGEVEGHTELRINGGTLSLAGARSLNASVNGGNLTWAGELRGGDHHVELNAGNVSLHLREGSSLRLEADVTLGALRTDFPTRKSGGFMASHHAGQLGDGAARLTCQVTAGQLSVTSQGREER
ncbi:hypothetical protein [Deinococcus petrolearius]|uniref:Adhesin domain-containing protein n=1 Tax=Deinococcus petrolearius TaxID=1751295 RepID=A0ABW1DIQ9_9DEIO